MFVGVLKQWEGIIEIDDMEIEDVSNFDFNALLDSSYILLSKKRKNSVETNISSDITEYRITVKQYMTKKATDMFNFMSQWNNDIPMPLRMMTGTIEKETTGMYYMKLRGDIGNKPVLFCMKCGKQITNPISQFFGMGPECGKHNYINPFDTEEELNAAVEKYRKEYLNKITWEGWVIKSAITEMEEVK